MQSNNNRNTTQQRVKQEEKNECWDYEENYVWKEDCITIAKKPRLAVKSETEKINKLLTHIPKNNITE